MRWKVLPVKKTSISKFFIVVHLISYNSNWMIFCKTLIVSIMTNYTLTTNVLPVCAEELFRVIMLLQKRSLYFTSLSYVMSYFF